MSIIVFSAGVQSAGVQAPEHILFSEYSVRIELIELL